MLISWSKISVAELLNGIAYRERQLNMFQIFYKDDGNLRQLRNIQPGAWVNITAPSGAEVEAISKLLNIPLSMLTDPLDEDERSRIEIEDDYLLILLRVPYFVGEEEVPFKTVPLVSFTVRTLS